MKNKKITIVTDPILYKSEFFSEGIKRILRLLRHWFISGSYEKHKYRGHFGVTRSLIMGLKGSKIKFNYNPYFISDVYDEVLVLANVRALQQAIQLKRKGFIKKIYAGPNIVIYANDHNGIIASDEIDVVITPSQPIIDLYLLDRPEITHKIIKWPAGVDQNYWSPNLVNKNKKQILIYEKQAKGPVGPINPYYDFIVSQGYTVKIIKYGKYCHNDYLKLLRESLLMVGFVTDESQGLAWAEAWSVDIPTFIWENDVGFCNGRYYSSVTAPYLNNENGIHFKDLEDFKMKFNLWENNKYKFKPRAWLMENMTDTYCAKELMKSIGAA